MTNHAPKFHRLPSRSLWLVPGTALGLAALLAGCQAPPPPVVTPGVPSVTRPEPVVVAPPGRPTPKVSQAVTPRDYRRDAAGHLYGMNGQRIFNGKLPPLIYAVGVLEVKIDRQGQVLGTNWLRAPKHAPEVIAEIERTVRQAAPFPAPVRMGSVTYTDTWLWDEGGKFQLDTLTEGQL